MTVFLRFFCGFLFVRIFSFVETRKQTIIRISAHLVSVLIHAGFFYLFISHFCIAGFFAFPTDFHFLVADFCIQDDVHSPSITIRLFFS